MSVRERIHKRLDELAKQAESEWVNVELVRAESPEGAVLRLELSIGPNRIVMLRLVGARVQNAIKMGPQHIDALIQIATTIASGDFQEKLYAIKEWMERYTGRTRRGTVRVSI